MIRRTPVPAGRDATVTDGKPGKGGRAGKAAATSAAATSPAPMSPPAEQVKVTFVLDDTAHEGAVSVVGDFNDWKPGAHVMRRRSNGTRSVSVTLPKGSEVRFRYLGANGHWFDDPEADAHDSHGGLLRL